jgi:hypothetical protein
MSQIAGALTLGEDLYEDSAVQMHKLGQLGIDQWGNRYRYVKAGGTALVVGNLLQEPAEDTQFVSMTPYAAAAIGATEVQVTNGTTTVTAGMFDGGFLTVSVTPGLGQMFRIVSHTTGVSGATITYTLDRPLKVALTTAASKVSVRKNPYNGVIQSPVTTMTGGPVGVAIVALTASYYGWIGTGGDFPVLFDTGDNTANDKLGIEASAAVAGTVTLADGATGSIYLGYSRQVASVDSTTSIVHLMLD